MTFKTIRFEWRPIPKWFPNWTVAVTLTDEDIKDVLAKIFSQIDWQDIMAHMIDQSLSADDAAIATRTTKGYMTGLYS